MEGQIGELEVDEQRLRAADPDRLYLFMLEDYPYMMTPDHVAAFTGTTTRDVLLPPKGGHDRSFPLRRAFRGYPSRWHHSGLRAAD